MPDSGDGRGVAPPMENVTLDGTKLHDDEIDVNVDSMLAHAGDFGRYQILLMVLFSLVNLFSAFHYFAQTFITVQPIDIKCATDFDYAGDNFTAFVGNLTEELKLLNQTRPNVATDDGCKRYHLDVTEIVDRDDQTIDRKFIWKDEDCASFLYEREFGYESIVTELDWVCKNSWKAAVGQSMYFIGAVIGTFLFGIASDKWGRVKSLIIAYVFGMIGNAGTVLSTDLELFAASRFVAGVATDTNFVMMYIIVMEYIKPSMRTFGLNICIGIFYCLGCSVVPWLAMAFETWRKFLIAITVGMVIVPSYYFILPESASWLLSQGRADEALNGYLKIAMINGKTISREVVERFKIVHNNVGEPQKRANIFQLFGTPRLRRKMFILIFKTMTLTLCYDAISRNIEVNGASSFLIFSLGSLTIFPACVVILILQDKIGRKALFFFAVSLSAILTTSCGLINAFVKETSVVGLNRKSVIHATVGLSVTARLCVVIAYNSGSQYAAELIPTTIRGRGIALIHVVGYAASFLSPLLLYLSRFWLPLPDLVLGSLCAICACATILLPETLGKKLPVTVEDGELFGESENPWEFMRKLFARSSNGNTFYPPPAFDRSNF